VPSANDPAQFVANITKLHEKFSKMASDVFGGDGEFVASLDRAIQGVVNHREDDPKQPPKISEKLNKYIDALMKTKKGKSETEIEAMLSKSIVIFRYIDDKDLFQKYYSKMLSNRLIGNLSFSSLFSFIFQIVIIYSGFGGVHDQQNERGLRL